MPGLKPRASCTLLLQLHIPVLKSTSHSCSTDYFDTSYLFSSSLLWSLPLSLLFPPFLFLAIVPRLVSSSDRSVSTSSVLRLQTSASTELTASIPSPNCLLGKKFRFLNNRNSSFHFHIYFADTMILETFPHRLLTPTLATKKSDSDLIFSMRERVFLLSSLFLNMIFISYFLEITSI